MNPMVYCGLFPIENKDYNDLREALEKLQLNDASLEFEPESSQALGFGFRTGFLECFTWKSFKKELKENLVLN